MSGLRNSAGILLLLCTTLLLAFGLNLKNYRFGTTPELTSQRGITFPDYSLAHAAIPAVTAIDESADGYYMRFAMDELRDSTNDRFEVLSALEYEKNQTFLIVGQWNEYLIFRKDELFSRSENASVYNIASFASTGKVEIDAIVLNSKLQVTVNKQTVQTAHAAEFTSSTKNLMLYLGGLSDKTNTWKGGLTEFDIGLCSDELAEDAETVSYCHDRNSRARYDFTSGKQDGLHDVSGNSSHLSRSSAATYHNLKWLTVIIPGGITSASHLRDMLINVIGFMPFGFLLILYRQHYADSREANITSNTENKMAFKSLVFDLITVFICAFLLSLFIESVQVLIPSRVSSVHDLAANSLGAALGAVVYIILQQFRTRVGTVQ